MVGAINHILNIAHFRLNSIKLIYLIILQQLTKNVKRDLFALVTIKVLIICTVHGLELRMQLSFIN